MRQAERAEKDGRGRGSAGGQRGPPRARTVMAGRHERSATEIQASRVRGPPHGRSGSGSIARPPAAPGGHGGAAANTGPHTTQRGAHREWGRGEPQLAEHVADGQGIAATTVRKRKMMGGWRCIKPCPHATVQLYCQWQVLRSVLCGRPSLSAGEARLVGALCVTGPGPVLVESPGVADAHPSPPLIYRLRAAVQTSAKRGDISRIRWASSAAARRRPPWMCGHLKCHLLSYSSAAYL